MEGADPQETWMTRRAKDSWFLYVYLKGKEVEKEPNGHIFIGDTVFFSRINQTHFACKQNVIKFQAHSARNCDLNVWYTTAKWMQWDRTLCIQFKNHTQFPMRNSVQTSSVNSPLLSLISTISHFICTALIYLVEIHRWSRMWQILQSTTSLLTLRVVHLKRSMITIKHRRSTPCMFSCKWYHV